MTKIVVKDYANKSMLVDNIAKALSVNVSSEGTIECADTAKALKVYAELMKISNAVEMGKVKI